MAWLCENCGREYDSAPAGAAAHAWRCPGCGSEARLASTEVSPPPETDKLAAATRAVDRQPPDPEAASVADAVASGNGEVDLERLPVDTVFQPVLMMESIMDELEAPAAEAPPAPPAEPGTETLETDPATLPSPFLQLDAEAFLLILGATPGQERRPLVRAKTSFGRRGCDVELDDPAVSGCHFQIEAFGKEFFVRDLESRNGTFLNGTKIRYSQLLPGDQITAGKTSLIFRTSDDLIDRD